MAFRTELLKGSTASIALKLLAEREMYGYEIVQAIHERTRGEIAMGEGTLYPCLHLLEEEGLLDSSWREASSGKKRKYYRITRKGRAALAERITEWSAFSRTINALLLKNPT